MITQRKETCSAVLLNNITINIHSKITRDYFEYAPPPLKVERKVLDVGLQSFRPFL